MAKSKGIAGIISLTLIFFYTVFSEEAASCALNGIKLCGRVLIPSLFPMMVLTGIAIRTGVFSGISNMGSKIFKPLFGIDGKHLASFIIGIIGSAPTGAMAVKSLSNGDADTEEASSALLLSSVVSFGFIYSVVGIKLLCNVRQGIFLFFLQMISVMTVAAVMRPKNKVLKNHAEAKSRSEKIPAAVALSIRDAASGMLSVCGSVIFFSSLSGIFTSMPIDGNIKAFICPFLELASGIEYLASSYPPDKAFILISSAVGWSGLSMILQSLSVIEGRISPHKYLIGRAASAVICPTLALIAVYLGII